MGTRSLTVLENSAGKEIVVMYRQMDGYPTGHGAELKEFLSPIRIGNGMGLSDKKGEFANGAECLAAQVVAHFKSEHGIGGIYLHPAGTRDCWEEYIYTITPDGPDINITVQTGEKTLYSGVISRFDPELAEAQEQSE